MPPRIRSLLPSPLFAREKNAPAEAPRVFREFVETLQKLDAAKPQPEARAKTLHPAARLRARRRRYTGNGVRRPSARRGRTPI